MRDEVRKIIITAVGKTCCVSFITRVIFTDGGNIDTFRKCTQVKPLASAVLYT